MPTSRVSSMPSMCTPGVSSTARVNDAGRKRRAGTAPWRVAIGGRSVRVTASVRQAAMRPGTPSVRLAARTMNDAASM